MPSRAATSDDGSLPIHRAFVVHLAGDGGPGRGRLRGRVEHLASGRAVQFRSLRALLRFFAATTVDAAVDGRG